MENLQNLKELVFLLCSAPGTPGDEHAAAQAAQEELEKYGRTVVDHMGNVLCELGDPSAARHILLDAHIDQIGMIVTTIDAEGFLRIAPCGGVDRRVLPGSPVVVYGKEKAFGIVCCLPPHLVEGGEDKVAPVDKMAVDVGMEKEQASKLFAPGDRVLLYSNPRTLLSNRITSAGLDDRAGAAVLLRCAELLSRKPLRSHVTVLLSSREEVGGQGARTAAYSLQPTEAIVVDVSFASQPGVPETKCGKLGMGPMIGLGPSIDRCMAEDLAEVARDLELPYQFEVMGGETGTNADGITTSREGVCCVTMSVPLRYMHTTAEVVDLADIETTAQIITEYVMGVK